MANVWACLVAIRRQVHNRIQLQPSKPHSPRAQLRELLPLREEDEQTLIRWIFINKNVGNVVDESKIEERQLRVKATLHIIQMEVVVTDLLLRSRFKVLVTVSILQ